MSAIGALLFVVVWLCGWAGGWCARGERAGRPPCDRDPGEWSR